ncbi:MAG TPA: hypothetical protein VMV57_13820 [Terracidiphilus sp.]|nr:hypothetical protein [Terracidiphilus sp.]
MAGSFFPNSYARAIADATARREALLALDLALRAQADGCIQFFKSLGISAGQEMRKANEMLGAAGFKHLFEGLYISNPPEYRIVMSFGGVPQAREVLLFMEDQSSPMISVTDEKKSPTGTMQFMLKDVGAGLSAYITEGGGTANWSISLTAEDVSIRIVENVIDGLYR